MSKRRRLLKGDEVVLVYDVNIGFVQQSAIFVAYRTVQYANVKHEIPVFQRHDSEITGLECFWALPHEVSNDDALHRLQYNILDAQKAAFEILTLELVSFLKSR